MFEEVLKSQRKTAPVRPEPMTMHGLESAMGSAPVSALADDLPPQGEPGQVIQTEDGTTYMWAETTGMMGATGAWGWIPYNP